MLTRQDFEGKREAIESDGRRKPDSERSMFYLVEVAAVALKNFIKENNNGTRKRSKATHVAASHGNKKKRVKHQKGRVFGASPRPDMPQEFKNRIQEMGGTEVELIIQKSLYETDLKKVEGRLSIPANQIRCRNFLTDKEKELLEKSERGKLKAIETKVIGPNLSEEPTDMNFKKWNMKKSNGRGSFSYVLTTNWNRLVANNPSTLKVGNIIQL